MIQIGLNQTLLPHENGPTKRQKRRKWDKSVKGKRQKWGKSVKGKRGEMRKERKRRTDAKLPIIRVLKMRNVLERSHKSAHLTAH